MWTQIRISRAAFGNDDLAVLSHFVNYGMKEGRCGCEAFNVLTYREKNGDLKAAFGDDLKQYYIHYMNYGKKMKEEKLHRLECR